MLRRGSLIVVLAFSLIVPTAPGAEAAPHVNEYWVTSRQVADAEVDDAGNLFLVDENTVGAMILRAYDLDGTQLWHRSWRPEGASLEANNIALGPGGTIIVSGTIRPDPPGACDEIWTHGWAIAVWDGIGAPLWHRAEHGWRTCDVFAESGRAVAAGGHTIALVARRSDEYSMFASVLAFDLRGRRRWRYEFDERGSGYQSVNDVAVGPDGAVYLAGTFNVQMWEEPPTDQEALLEKLDADGGLTWRRVVPDPGRRDDRAGSVSLAGGNVSFSSMTDVRNGPYRGRVASYSTDGTLRWERFTDRVVQSGWRDMFLATRGGRTLLATSRRKADRSGVHILIRSYAANGSTAWTRDLRRGEQERACVATGLAARGAAIVVVGYPADGATMDRSLLWVLQS